MEKNIIIPSWELVNNSSIIKKFNFLPSLISTLYLSAIVLYQVAYSYIIIFQKKDEFFSLVIDFTHTSYFLEVILWAILWLLLYILISPIAEAWVICLIDVFSKKEEEKQKASYWFSQWILNFLPLFEFHNFMWLFKLLSIVTFYFLLLRIFGSWYAMIITIIMLIYMLFAIFINMLFAYTKFYIIFEKKWVFEAISLSTKMTLHNIDLTTKLYYTLFLVYARVIISVILFIIFALIFSFIFTYITSKILLSIWIWVALVLFIIFILFISHFNSALEIFVDALWYNTYIENKKSMPVEEN